jgi:DNA replication protein DnaC
VRALSTADAARLKAQYPNLWADPEKTCITCQKTGHYRWYMEDTDLITRFACDCVSQWRLHRWLLNAGVGTWYQRLRWYDATAVSEETQRQVMEYVRDHQASVDAGLGLVLWSPDLGTGKTLMSVLTAKSLLREGEDVFFVQFNDLIDYFTAGWRDEAERRWFNRRVRNADVLVIDDLGREHKGRSEVVEAMLDQVIRHRTAMARPTIITTNSTPDKMQRGYGSNVMSLLSERSLWVPLTGRDFRSASNTRTQNEKAQNLTRPLVLG